MVSLVRTVARAKEIVAAGSSAVNGGRREREEELGPTKHSGTGFADELIEPS